MNSKPKTETKMKTPPFSPLLAPAAESAKSRSRIGIHSPRSKFRDQKAKKLRRLFHRAFLSPADSAAVSPSALRCSMFGVGCSMFALALSGCTMLTYTSPSGEKFTRSAVGSTTSISSLSVEADTNGFRKVELRGYTNDSSSALGAITEAAIKAAIQSAK
jgi:hypothetical protein